MKASARMKTKLQKLRADRDKTRRFRALMERIIPDRKTPKSNEQAWTDAVEDLSQIPPSEIFVAVQGLGEKVAMILEEAGFTVTQAYPRGTQVSAEWLNGLSGMANPVSLPESSETSDVALLPDQQGLQCLRQDDSRSTEQSASVEQQEDREL